jgi:hypothetical protein
VASIDVTSELDWTASSSEDWLSVAQSSGTGNVTGIVVKANSANTDVTPREAVVSVTAAGQTAFITFRQDGKTTGLNDIKNNPIRIYPNPSNGLFTLEFKNNSVAGDAVIYNTLGEIVRTVTIRNSVSEIDMTSFAKGQYFIKITGKNELFKIIKQ